MLYTYVLWATREEKKKRLSESHNKHRDEWDTKTILNRSEKTKQMFDENNQMSIGLGCRVFGSKQAEDERCKGIMMKRKKSKIEKRKDENTVARVLFSYQNHIRRWIDFNTIRTIG